MDVRLPDGTVIKGVPDGMSKADLTAKLKGNGYDVSGWDAPAQKQPQSWGDVASSAASNMVPSLGRMASGMFEAVTSPVKTAKSVLDLGAGALQNVLPESLVQAVGEDKSSRNVANAVGQHYKSRYGSIEGLKEAISTDPAGVMADASTLLGVGAMAAPGRAGAVLKSASSAIDPMALALRGGAKAISGAGSIAKKVLGGTTGVGEEAISQAYRAGKTGGETASTFTANMRGASNMDDVLTAAKENLQAMVAQKQQAYRSGMTNIKADKSVLDMSGIDKALNDSFGLASFKGQIKNESAANALGEINKEIANWKSLDPAEFHTPEGLDALKQKIGGIVEEIPFEQKTARMAAGKVYDSIKSEITKQAPEYSKVMSEYSGASDTIKEIERALSLGPSGKVAADTSMRKLQSLMRNNANTNYGYRTDLAKTLEQAGGQELMPALAGQALNEWTPRGIQKATVGTGTAGLAWTGNVPAAVGLAASSSPRLVGEMAYGAGSIPRLLKEAPGMIGNTSQGAEQLINALRQGGQSIGKMNIDPRILANLLYQSSQPSTISGQ